MVLDTYIPVNIAPTYIAPMVGAMVGARFTNRGATIEGIVTQELGNTVQVKS